MGKKQDVFGSLTFEVSVEAHGGSLQVSNTYTTFRFEVPLRSVEVAVTVPNMCAKNKPQQCPTVATAAVWQAAVVIVHRGC